MPPLGNIKLPWVGFDIPRHPISTQRPKQLSRFLIGLTVYENLDMHLMDVVIIYLHESLDNDIYKNLR